MTHVGRPLTNEEKAIIASWPPNDHHKEVGGNWELTGRMQLEFLKKHSGTER